MPHWKSGETQSQTVGYQICIFHAPPLARCDLNTQLLEAAAATKLCGGMKKDAWEPGLTEQCAFLSRTIFSVLGTERWLHEDGSS